MKKVKMLIVIFLSAIILVSATGCSMTTTEPTDGATPPGGVTPNKPYNPIYTIKQTANLMENLSPNCINGKPTDAAFIASVADFSIELFKNSISDKGNSLVSPLSVMLALSMTANGADSQTLSQMEMLLGGGMSLNDLNECIYSYIGGLPSEEKVKLSVANSIWFRDDGGQLQINPGFLQINADYYNAAAYSSPFDDSTVQDINNWVMKNTDGMIDNILDEISPDAVIYLINAVVFDAEWRSVYSKENIQEGVFIDINVNKQKVNFMYSEETKYLDDGKATGFIKPYVNEQYSFVALLPNESVPIDKYIETLTGTGLINTINNAESKITNVAIPKFSYEYEIQMNDTLRTLGILNAFDENTADFSKMATSGRGNIFIFEVLHKTFISVDELGTKAGAATKVDMQTRGIPQYDKTVILDRPFVYAIIDNSTSLPVFIGTIMTI